MKRFLIIFGFLLLLPAVVTLAQQTELPNADAVLEDETVVLEGEPEDEEEEEDGFLLGFIQDLLSAPGREVRIRGVSGILSSAATIDEIAVSDAEGIWLRVKDVVIDWNRSALFLRRIDITSLQIGEIAYLRPPLPPEAEAPRLEDVEAEPFSLPELPLAVRVAELDIEQILIGEPVFGQAATLTTEGYLTLEGGELDTELAIRRLDEPGGALTLDAAFSNETRELELDVALREPAGGVVATALDIEGRPAIDLSLEGSGPVENLDVSFSLDADGEQLVAGQVALRESDGGLAFGANFAGEIAPLVPPDYRDFFAGRSAVRVSGLNKAEGGIQLDDIAVTADALSIEGSLETGADGFLRSLELAGDLGDPENGPVTLPVPGGETTLQSGALQVNFGQGDRWDGELVLEGLTSGDLAVDDLVLTMGGIAENLEDPTARNVTITAEGLATGLSSEDPDVDAALGERIAFTADVALPPDAPVEVRELRIEGSGLSVFTAGNFEDLVYDGRFAVQAEDLAPFSGLAGRDLAGQLDLEAEGEVFFSSGGFDLALDGSADDLEVGLAQVDPLLQGETTISGRLRRNEDGLLTDDLQIANEQVSFTSNGIVSGDQTEIGFEARLEDLGLVLPEASGSVVAEGRATGAEGPIEVVLEASMPEGSLLGREVTELAIGFDGEVNEGNVTAVLSGGGRLNGSEVGLEGELAVIDERRSISDFRFTVGPNAITGSLVQEGEAPIEGLVEVRAPDVAPLAALALVEASGEADATIRFSPADVGQGISVSAELTDLAIEGNRVEALQLEAEIEDAFGVPLADATLAAEGIAAGGLEIAQLEGRAEHADPNSMDFSAESRLAIGTEVALAGSLARLEDGFAVTLERLLLEQEEVAARLAEAATIRISGGQIALSPLALDVGEGRIEAEGTVGDELDLSIAIDDLALSIANAVQPSLGLGGTVNGEAQVTGSQGAPEIAFNILAADLTAAALEAANLPPVTLSAEGTTDGATLNLEAALSGADGLQAEASGAVPLGEEGELDLSVDIGALPLALVDPLAGGQGLQGTVTGNAEVSGNLAEPNASFSISGSGLSATVLRENGVPALSASAEGSFAENVLTLESASVTGPGAISATASGTVPIDGGPIDLALSGALPLALANPALAERTTQLAGTAEFDLSIGGDLADPQISGPVAIDGGTLVDPQTNIRLENIALDASLEGRSVNIDSLRARSAQGGTVTVSGTIGLQPGAGIPVDLAIRLQDLAYTDGSFFTTQISGALSLTGPVGDGAGRLAGEIVVDETEVSVAEGFGGSAAGALQQITHKSTPPAVQETLDRASLDEPVTEEAAEDGPGLLLDVLVRAPNQIFIRGRGLDAEVGGELLLQGSLSDVQPVGQFNLIRGRLNILGQRIEFDEGRLQLVGNLDPIVFFQARTEAQEAVAIVTVSGRVSEPDIEFSSIPELPEDEVLALILFNRNLSELSPFQIAQLAAAAAELAGAGGNGLLSQFRGAIGLDDLDIVTTEEGDAAVRAGRYIDDNIYLDVQTATGGDTRVSVNLDITEGITARGTVGSAGNSTLGIYYEKDY